MKIEKTQKAFSQVYDIINHFEPELYSKIPKKFITFLEENKDNNYISGIDYTKSINEQTLLHETKVILSIVYRKYICDEEKKMMLRQEDNIDYYNEQKKLEEKYKLDFESINLHKEDNCVNLPKVRMKWYQRIIQKIRSILKL